MSLEFFIAKRIYKGDKKNEKRVSSPAIKIAIAGIALGLAVMIVSVCIIVGFKKEIREKVVGFGSHIQLTSFNNDSEYEDHPIAISDSLRHFLNSNPNIAHIQEFSTKPAVIKTDDDFMGIVLKGVSETYDWNFFKKNITKGEIININDTSTSNSAIISEYIANKLNLKLGDNITAYFIQEPVRARQFKIVGLYETNFEEYDKLFAVIDSKVISRLNGWDDDMASGIEILVNNFSKLEDITQDLFYDLATQKDRLGNTLYPRSINDINPMIFNWLELLDMNVWVILVLMTLVSGFTMISGLLIIILERTNMIGMLKSMGARDFKIRKVFLYLSAFLIGQGMIWGNIIALLFCFIQKHFQILKLDPSIYYLTSVPIDLNPINIILLNVATLIVSLLMMLGPSYLVAKITPAKSIKFE